MFKAKGAPRIFLRQGFWLGLGWSSSAPKVGGLGRFPEFLSQFLVCLRLCGVRDAPPHQRFWPGLSWSSSAPKVGILGHFPEFLSQFLVCLKPWCGGEGCSPSRDIRASRILAGLALELWLGNEGTGSRPGWGLMEHQTWERNAAFREPRPRRHGLCLAQAERHP